MTNKVLIFLIITLTTTQLCHGSAIPMWEFLSRNEKMSHLYSIFAKLVSDYCKTSYEVRNFPVAQCKRDLLTYASDKLQQMSDISLDLLDPYQRGANELIWNSIMKEHPNVRPATTRPQYSLGQSTTGAGSSKNQIQTLTPTAGTLLGDASIIVFGNNQINGYEKNPLFDGIDNVPSAPSSSVINKNNSASSSYAIDMDAAYGNFHHTDNKKQSNTHKQTFGGSAVSIASPLASLKPQSVNTNSKKPLIYEISDIEVYQEPTSHNYLASPPKTSFETSTNYLTGPLVIRVRPDGTPVEEDKYKPLPRDDDREFIVGNSQFGRRQKNFVTKLDHESSASEIVNFQPSGQQVQQQQQRYQQRLRRQYRNTQSFRRSYRRY